MNLLISLYTAITNLFKSKQVSPYAILLRFNEIRNTHRANQQVGDVPFFSNRVNLIIKILAENNIHYIVDVFSANKMKLCNVIVILNNAEINETVVHDVHHDVVNLDSLNILDNTASIANLLSLAISLKGKKLKRKTVIAFVDAEETGGLGAERVAKQILNGKYGNVVSAISFELTGSGNIWTDSLGNGFIKEKLNLINKNMPKHDTPRNDVDVYLEHDIHAICLGTMPDEQMKILQQEGWCPYWNKCHKSDDDMDFANEEDMKKFVNQIKTFSF